MAAMMIFSSSYAVPTLKVTVSAAQSKASAVKLSKCKVTYKTSFVYTGKYIKPSIKVTYGGKTLKAGKHYTVKYSNNRKVGTAKITITAIKNSGYTGSRTVKFRIVPQTVSGLKVTSVTANSATLSWNKSPLATGYGVFSYNSKTKKYTRLAISKTNSVTLKKLSPGTIYRISVRAFAYNKSEDKYYRAGYSALVKATTKPSAAPKIAISYPTSDSVRLSWNPVAGASGYYVYYYQPDLGYRIKIADAKTATNYTIKNLDQGTYNFSIAAYKTDGSSVIVGELSPLTAAKVNNGSFKLKKYARMTATGNYQMTFKTNTTELSGRTYTFGKRNGNIAVQTTVDNVSVRILNESGSYYAVINNETYRFIDLYFNTDEFAGTFIFPSSGLTTTLEYVGKTLCTVNSRRGSDGNLRKFYFNGDELVRIVVIAPSATTIFYISDFKSPADSGLFDRSASPKPFSSIFFDLI